MSAVSDLSFSLRLAFYYKRALITQENLSVWEREITAEKIAAWNR